MPDSELSKLLRLVRWVAIGALIVFLFPPVAEFMALLIMGLFSTD